MEQNIRLSERAYTVRALLAGALLFRRDEIEKRVATDADEAFILILRATASGSDQLQILDAPHGVIPVVLLPFHPDFSIGERSYRKHLR